MGAGATQTIIVIPARYGSSRLPGKPLADIAGHTMLARVVALAHYVARRVENTTVLVATEDERIMEHAHSLGVACTLTPADCPTGSDRVLAALQATHATPDFVVNLQGDAPFTDPHMLENLIETFQNDPTLEVITPVHRLEWAALDTLRTAKQTTPFSGTTAILNKDERALWFSKTIIPAIRNERDMRENDARSPVYQHIGLYGFRRDILEQFCDLYHGFYEQCEGLEQLRLLEAGISIQTIQVPSKAKFVSAGIDSPEDITRAESLIKKFGDPMDEYIKKLS